MRVIIIGGVAAGMSAASKLKRLKKDTDVIVYEKTDIVSFGACGLPYYAGGFFDDKNEMLARTPEEFKKSGIELNIFHEVINVNTDKKEIEVKNLKTNEVLVDKYDKLMIATGARSIIPPVKNVKLDNVSTLKSMDDGIKIRNLLQEDSIKNVVIIGAGFIGIEAIEACKRQNKKVTIFQLEERILPQVFDKEITDILEEEIRNHNVDLRLNEAVSELVGSSKVEAVITSKGEKIAADLVIIATGVRPNTEILSNTNIEMLKNGAIIVNEYGETSIKDIYAAGDCATIKNIVTKEDSYVPLATGANKLGRIVGENLAGLNKKYQGSLNSSCIKIMNMESASTGLTEEAAKKRNLNYKSVFISDYNQTSYYPGRDKMYVKLIYDADTKVILGGQIIGFKDAVQRVNVIATAIYAKLTTAELGNLDL
ncbi:MAG: CoA-disulfide reductase, partial [Clostridiaceae bacterium]|nr:CoA-disulfide reductase [Clostridiaceae bacterium]